MKRKRRITKCYFNMFLKRYNQMLLQITTRRFGNTWEENISLAYQELLYAMIHFDQRKYPQTGKGSFFSFAYSRVSYKMRHAVTKSLRQNRIKLLDNEQIDQANGSYDNLDLPILVEELLSRLTLREREIVEKYYLQGKSLAKTAEEVGFSLALISRNKDRAIAKLRRVVVV